MKTETSGLKEKYESLIREATPFLESFYNWIKYFLFLFTVFLLVGFSRIEINNIELYIPVIDPINSLSTKILNFILNIIVPSDTEIITINPLTPFIARIQTSMAVAFLILFPKIIYDIFNYLKPALYEKEENLLKIFLFPSILLFYLGILFALLIFIPLTIKFLFPFSYGLNIKPYFDLNELLGLIYGLSISIGLSFLFPVLMSILTFLEIVSLDYWKKNWKYFFAAFVFIGAIVTPDGTGITMILFALVLMGLYFSSFIITKALYKYKGNKVT